jgi:segregation and condensation protein B
MEEAKLLGKLEALLFASGEPLTNAKLANLCGAETTLVKEALKGLAESLENNPARGVMLMEVANGWQLRTKVEFGKEIRELKGLKPTRLSVAALETLSVVAYKQPIVKSAIERIRGVETGPTLKTLLDRSLIKIVGYQESVGQPALYGTTEEFLNIFGLQNLKHLPPLKYLITGAAEPGEHDAKIE